MRAGQHATIPLRVYLAKQQSIDINGIDMIIAAEQSTEIQCAVAIALHELLVLATRERVEVTESVNLGELANRLVLSARNGVESHYRVSVNNVERLAMALEAHRTQPELFIREAKNAILENNLVISAHGGVEIRPTIQIEETMKDNMILTVSNGIQIDLMKALGNINSNLEFNLSKRSMKIKDWDGKALTIEDGWKLSRMIEIPFDVALDVGILADDSGELQLVLYANDGVETILTHPMIIGTIDPKKIGELDPYFVPDSITE